MHSATLAIIPPCQRLYLWIHSQEGMAVVKLVAKDRKILQNASTMAGNGQLPCVTTSSNGIPFSSAAVVPKSSG